MALSPSIALANFIPGTAQSIIDLLTSALANTTFNIDNFKTTLDKHAGVQKPTLFNVTIPMPPVLQLLYSTGTETQDLSMLCFATQIPGPQIDTKPVRRYGYGLPEDMPFNTVFTPVELIFIGDGESYIINFFRTWQRSIQEHSSEGIINTPPSIGPNRTTVNMLPYLFNYKDDYVTALSINLYDTTTKLVDKVYLREAYPVNIQNIDLSWENTNNFMAIAVTFTFRDLSYDQTTIPNLLGQVLPSSLGADIFSGAASIIGQTATTLIPLLNK